MSDLKNWVLAARPKTLPAAIVPVWVGNLPVLFSDANFSWILFWATLLSCICIQIATNFFNDAIDFDKGADTEKRLGPVRATASGLLSRKTVFLAACGFCALAALISIPMIQARGWSIIAIGVVSLFFSYGYTGGPVPLAYKGLGEIFVILFFGLVAVIGSFWVQSGTWPVPGIVWVLALQTGLFSTVLIAINNLRDLDEDRGTGKKTLAVRFGKTLAKWEIALISTAPYLLAVYAMFSQTIETPTAFSLLSLLVPLSVFICERILKNEPGPIYNKLLAISGLQLILFGVVMTFIFWRT